MSKDFPEHVKQAALAAIQTPPTREERLKEYICERMPEGSEKVIGLAAALVNDKEFLRVEQGMRRAHPTLEAAEIASDRYDAYIAKKAKEHGLSSEEQMLLWKAMAHTAPEERGGPIIIPKNIGREL